MKIVDRSERFETTFDKIKVGDAFCYPLSGGIYMRTENVFDDAGHVMLNAVNLLLGSLCVFPHDYKVIALNCECIIEDKVKGERNEALD